MHILSENSDAVCLGRREPERGRGGTGGCERGRRASALVWQGERARDHHKAVAYHIGKKSEWEGLRNM
jgi:hypothetical protein